MEVVNRSEDLRAAEVAAQVGRKVLDTSPEKAVEFFEKSLRLHANQPAIKALLAQAKFALAMNESLSKGMGASSSTSTLKARDNAKYDKSEGERIAGFRKQGEFGAKKFIKP